MRSRLSPKTRLSSLARNRLFMEALEPRQLLSYTWITEVADTGNPTTNGLELKNVLNGTTTHGGIPLQLGDTIVLAAGVTYIAPVAGFVLADLTAGSGTVTIESSDIYNNLGHLPAGVRVGPAQSAYMPQLETKTGNGPAIATAASAQNYNLLGLEVLPISNTLPLVNLVQLGFGDSTQSSVSQVPINLLIDRCYIHGLDATSTSAESNTDRGIALNSGNTTISNCYISNIHNTGQDCQAIGGWNGTGNYTITNNFLEASCENVMFGGADSSLPVGVDQSNITITHNLLFKPLTWDPMDPSFNLPAGVHYSVKNVFEIKHATNVVFDQNVLENCWIGADQRAEAMIIRPLDQNGGNTWALVHDVTVTNNVILNCGNGIQLGMSFNQTPGNYTTLPMYNVLVRNNLLENIAAGPTLGDGNAFTVGGPTPGYNVTIDHNTALDTNNFLVLGAGVVPYSEAVNQGFTLTNNIAVYGVNGGGDGNGINALGTYISGVTMTNLGAGYTSAPTVTFSGGLGTGGVAATATALINNGQVYNLKITNPGSGYTSAPTITFNNTGTGETTASTATCIVTAGHVGAWIAAGNVQIRDTVTNEPTGNFFPATVDAAGFLDTPGDEFGLLSTSPYFTDGVDANGNPNGSTPGANMAGFSGITDFTAIDSTLQDYYKFDNNSTDNGLVGTQHNATLNGTAAYTSSTGGEMNYGLNPGSAGDASATLTPSANFTFAAWINPTSTTSKYIASTGASGPFTLSINSSGKLTATTSNGATVTDSSVIATNTWTLVAITYDNSTGTLTLYKDGASVGSNSHTGSISTASTTLYIGGNNGTSNSFAGTIDEVRYYSSALTATDLNGDTTMQRLYNNNGPLVAVINPNATSTTATTTMSTSAYSHNSNSTASNLTYTWSLYSFNGVQGAGSVTFSANGTNAAKTTTATWNSGNGVYDLLLTVTDDVGDSSTLIHPMSITGLNPPAAPSNISTTPGLSTVTVTWTDNATNETGFDVQRSSDGGAHWTDLGNVASATGSGSIVTYTDSTPLTDGTAYIYEVDATGSPNSSFVATTCAVACPIAYEGFGSYSAGNWSGGTDLGATWTVGGTTSAHIITPGLTYSQTDGSGLHTLTTSNNALTLTNGDKATGTLTSSIATPGSTLWVGFLLSIDKGTSSTDQGQVDIGGTNNQIRLGSTSSSLLQVTVSTSNGFYTMSSTNTTADKTTYFLAYQIQYGATGSPTIITQYIDPVPGVTPTSNQGVLTVPATSPLSATNVIDMWSNIAANTATFDEIRLGKSYAAVAPDPLVLATTPTYISTPLPSTTSPFTIPNSLFVSPTHALFHSFLAVAPVLDASPDLTLPTTSDYHLQGDASDQTDTPDSIDLTIDPNQPLLWTD